MKKCKTEGCNNDFYCKEMCQKCYDKQYRLDHKEEKEEYFRQYRLDNKEELNKISNQYYLDHKEESNKKNKQYRLEHKEEIKVKEKQYRLDHKEEKKERDKQYRLEHKEEAKQYRLDHKEEAKQYRLDHKEEEKEYSAQYYLGNKEEKRIYSKQYRLEHKEERNKHLKQRRETWDNLPYTPEELRTHLEELWDHPDSLDENGNVWMTWKNHGIANSNKRTWNIDHKIPQSKLIFTGFDQPNFLKCWRLDNLRPLDAIENIKKGNK